MRKEIIIGLIIGLIFALVYISIEYFPKTTPDGQIWRDSELTTSILPWLYAIHFILLGIALGYIFINKNNLTIKIFLTMTVIISIVLLFLLETQFLGFGGGGIY
ncbi:MAG: hypothetical protein AABX54_00570 [Nanoarchaeota archaeon]